jgi:hypothetical protein
MHDIDVDIEVETVLIDNMHPAQSIEIAGVTYHRSSSHDDGAKSNASYANVYNGEPVMHGALPGNRPQGTVGFTGDSLVDLAIQDNDNWKSAISMTKDQPESAISPPRVIADEVICVQAAKGEGKGKGKGKGEGKSKGKGEGKI